jgi:hypothetical protein
VRKKREIGLLQGSALVAWAETGSNLISSYYLLGTVLITLYTQNNAMLQRMSLELDFLNLNLDPASDPEEVT